jgi:uncharacterized membrane protein YhaH (DUF805 family)
MQPWWFLLAFIPILGVIVVRNALVAKRLRDQVKDGRTTWTDEWDPYQ